MDESSVHGELVYFRRVSQVLESFQVDDSIFDPGWCAAEVFAKGIEVQPVER